MKEKNVINAYKGFDKDLKCRGFQYEIGGEYKLPEGENVEICARGFHAIPADKSPLNVFEYYPPSINGNRSRYCEVEIPAVNCQQGNKCVSSQIKIGAEIGLTGLVKAHINWVKSRITNNNNAENGKPATAGYCGEATAGNRGEATAGNRGAATAGDCGAATAGDCGAATAGDGGAATAGNGGAATAGDRGAATAGDRGAATAGDGGAATAGYCGAATAGDCGAATAGDCGAATAGDCGAATSRGSSASGENGLSVARGNNVKVKGGIGALLVIAEECVTNHNIDRWTAVVVDGEKIKADTWYQLVNGELIETE